jgi:WD40 repeat protein/energy-coupling factor transporter ATP-binding protein EcfA2
MTQVFSIKEDIVTEPYPGLRPFQQNESHLFFGRDEQVDKLLEKIQDSHFVAVVGPSGCGKSSLVKAGLIPALKTGCILDAGSAWRMVEMRPGDKPFHNLAKALAQSFAPHRTPLEYIKAELKRSPKGLIEVLKSECPNKKENLLLVADQFEELFRYKQNNNIDEVTAFIALLIASAKQQEVSIHVIITMRSDFLGDCSLFLGLPEILNDNQFLTPRLTREQTQEAIEGPALVCGGQLKPKLVNTLLNDMGVDHDQLPLLQHALMRMWALAREDAGSQTVQASALTGGSSGNNDGILTVGMDDYAKVGKLKKALSEHANQIYNKLTSRQQQIVEVIFKRLSERNAEQKDIRRPATVQDIADVAHVSTEEVIAVANYFRTQDNSFLTPPADVELNPDTYLDISHESIIRQWDKMCGWVDEEYEDTNRFKRLLADAADYRQGKGDLLSGIELVNTLKWERDNKINHYWASRYLQGTPDEKKAQYKQVRQYVEESSRKQRRRKYRNNSLIGAFALLLVAVVLLSFINIHNQLKNHIKLDIAETEREVEKARAEEERKQKESIQFQKETIERKNKDIDLQRLQLARLNNKLNKNIAKLDSQNRELNIKGFISTINQLSFYHDLDSANKSLAVQTLLPLYFENRDSVKFNNLPRSLFMKTNGLSTAVQQFADTINEVMNIKANALVNPTAALRDARKLWNHNKRPLIASLFTKMVNNCLFYKQESNLFDYTNFVSFAFAPASTHFVATDGYTQVITGSYHNGTLIPDKSSSQRFESSLRGKYIVAVALTHDTLLLADNIGTLYLKNKNRDLKIMPLADSGRYRSYLFSPGGKYLISIPVTSNNRYNLTKDPTVKLYTVAALISNQQPAPVIIDKMDKNNTRIKTIQFSPDNSYVSLLYDNGTFKLWNITTRKEVSAPTPISNINANTFFPENNYLITIGGTLARVIDSNNLTTKYQDINLPVDDTTKDKRISNIALSPDRKKLAVVENGGLRVYERSNGAPIFVESNNQKNFISKKYTSKSGITNISFIDTNTIVTSENAGSIRLWKTYPVFNNPDMAFSNITIPALCLVDSLLEDASYLTYLLKTKTEAQLDSLAASIESGNKGRLQLTNIKKQIYKKLLQIGAADKQNDYQNAIVSLNEDLVYLEQTQVNGKTINYTGIINDLKENVNILKEQLQKDTTNAYLHQKLSSTYWDLSWYLVLNKNMAPSVRAPEIISAAQKAVQYNPLNNGAITNLALGYLLNKEFDKAEAVYRKFKGQKFSNKDLWFTSSFLQDLEALERAGIITPDLEKEVAKIKAMLNSN